MITKECVILSKINKELEILENKIKDSFNLFYRENIGNIDKEKSISLEDYIVMQDEQPFGTATIKLHQNKYVLQKEREDKTYLYIPFEKKKTLIIPKDNKQALQELEEKFIKFRPLSKKQLLEKIYSENTDKLKNLKITKKFFLASNMEDLTSILESNGIDDLSHALNYYTVTKTTKKRMVSKIPKEIIETSPFYEKLEEVRNKLDEMTRHDALYSISLLKKEVKKELSNIELKIAMEMDCLKTDNYMTFSKREELCCENIPASEYILEKFFKKELDMSKIKKEVYKGNLDLEMKSKFIFYEPCSNLSEIMDRFSSIEFVKSCNNNLSYSVNDVLALR